MNLGGGVHLIHAKVAQCLCVLGPPLTLIDTGRMQSTDRIARALHKHGKRLEDVEQILITHSHHDHIGSAAEVKKASGARVLIHRNDRAAASGQAGPHKLGEEGVLAMLTRPFRASLENWAVYPPVEIDGALEDGMIVEPGLRVVETPGHTPGHCAILIDRIELIHCGDAIWNLTGLTGPPLMLNDDQLKVSSSIARIAKLDFKRATFGHGPPLMRGADWKIRRLAERSASGLSRRR